MQEKNLRLSIIVPVYNEAATVRTIVEHIQQVRFPIEYEIIIVDDASSMPVGVFKKRFQKNNFSSEVVRVFRNPVNRGKGFSIREGIKRAVGNIMIVQDADTEYDPQDIPKLLEPILNQGARVVYGSRFLKCFWPKAMTPACWLANRGLTALTNILFGLRLTDMETCYKIFLIDVIRDLPLKADRFTFEPEVTALLAKQKIPIRELPISYQARSRKAGKKIRPRDFFAAVGVLVGQRLYAVH